MEELEERDSATTENEWFEASRITKLYCERFDDLEDKSSAVMAISGVLTHLKRERLVERHVSTDKKFAWWRRTSKGKNVL
jgi:hypothetical protein